MCVGVRVVRGTFDRLSDESLAVRASRGDESAYAALYGRHVGDLADFATWVVRDRELEHGDAVRCRRDRRRPVRRGAGRQPEDLLQPQGAQCGAGDRKVCVVGRVERAAEDADRRGDGQSGGF